MRKYDVIIIGSGQGGNPLAHKLADQKWKVALIERDQLGGTCVNVGCTPTKTMIASARIAHYARIATGFGVHTGSVEVRLKEVVRRKNKMVQQWRDGQQRHVDTRRSLHLYRAHARFVDSHTIDVDGTRLRSDSIVIDTGARARIPQLDGIHESGYLTSTTMMDVQDVPDHLIVLGGNYIGLEFGQMFRRFGSKVTVIEKANRLIAREDEEVSTTLQRVLEQEKMTFYLGAEAKKITRTSRGISLSFASGNGRKKTVTGSHLLVAVGRVPNTDDLGLEAAGVTTDPNGYIETDEYLRTSTPGVWAIGDVKGGPAFTHIAYDDHFIVLDQLLDRKGRTTRDRLVPYAMYTDPELGRVGLSEREAREKGYKLKVGCIPMEQVARAKERGETAGLMKVVVDADTDLILGAAILGSEGGELVQTLMALMMTGAPWTTFQNAVFIHPTLTEGFFTLMENVKKV